MDKKISFEVQGFDVIDDYSDNQFAIAEMYVTMAIICIICLLTYP